MTALSIAIHNLPNTRRLEYTIKCLESLLETVDFNKHCLYLGDNASCQATKDYLNIFENKFRLKFPENNLKKETHIQNLGTAQCVNRGWKWAKDTFGEKIAGFVKMDNDVVVLQSGWVELLEECIAREPRIGIIALKRKDLRQTPWDNDAYFRSELMMLPHQPGQRWLIIERTADIMGTCTMMSASLINRVGYLFQDGQYGMDDSDISTRSRLSGFINAFYSSIDIEHIDEGGDDYTKWKHDYAMERLGKYFDRKGEYERGERELYYNPYQ